MIENKSLKFLALAGAEEIGMNMTLYSYENNNERYAIIVDCGVGFINLPGAQIAIPNIEVLEKMNIKIQALVITHGHEDHIGAIPHLIDQLNCPIYATPFTVGLIKAKLEYAKKTNYTINQVEINDTINLGPFKIKYLRATHSIPDNAMLAIEVNNLKILHTGDWKNDRHPLISPATDFENIKKFAENGLDYLISDSTNINELEESISEEEVGNSLLKIMQNMKNSKHNSKGKFVLTCFSSNIARVKSVIDAAKLCNRKVLIIGSSLKKTSEIAVKLNYITSDLFVSEEEAINIPPENLAIIATGSQAEENSALWKMANQMRSSGSVLNAGDVLIFSARVIDGKQIDVRKIINQLIERGVKIIHPWNTNSLIHASGHPTRPDVEQLLNLVKPNIVIPVHCEAEHRLSHIDFVRKLGYKAYNLHNNYLIELSKDQVNKIEKFSHISKLVLDGNRIISENNKVFLKRKEMNINGFIMISIKFSNKKHFSIVTNFGLFEEQEKSTSIFNKEIKKEVDKTIENMPITENDSEKNYNLKNKIIYSIKKYVKDKINKTPIIGVHFL